jgi:hypothetical protein
VLCELRRVGGGLLADFVGFLVQVFLVIISYIS